jgi:hypothetical protein
MKRISILLFIITTIIACSKSDVENAVDLLEYQISGSSKSVTIVTVNALGKTDSLKNQLLPYSLKYKTFDALISVVHVINNKASGDIQIVLLVQGVQKTKYSVTEPRATAKVEYNTKTTEVKTSSIVPEEWNCNFYNGHYLITGPKGGCYYYNSNGNKTYVDRSNCSCD